MKNLPLKFGKNAKNCKEIEKNLSRIRTCIALVSKHASQRLKPLSQPTLHEIVVWFYIKYISQYAAQIFDD